MSHNHWSDCGLHNGPASRPTWCDCGGFERQPSFWEKLTDWARMNWWYLTGRL